MKMQNSAAQDLYIEQAALNELPEETRKRLEMSPGFNQSRFEQQIEEIHRLNDEFHQRVSSEEMLRKIREKSFTEESRDEHIRRDFFGDETANRRRFRFPAAMAAAIPVLFAAAILIGFQFAGQNGGLNEGIFNDQTGVRTKGLEPRIFVYRNMGGGEAELLAGGTSAVAGDVLQISYLSTGKNYGAIFSIDGTGVTTLHFPENSDILPRLQPRDEVYLPYGYRLDDAPSYERFYFVTSDEAFDVDQLLASIRPQLRSASWKLYGELDLPDEFSVQLVEILKSPGSEQESQR